jgi:release factor glutamine methyltransferase
MLIKEVVEKSNQFLKSKGIESSRLDAELIIADVLKMERIALYLKYDQPLSDDEINICRQKILERSKGVPVAYLLNKKFFYNYEFFVNNNVLIPRPETELLVEETLNWIKQSELEEVSILDLGCGSGCISISLIAEMQKLKIKCGKIIAVDISPAAIEVSKINAKRILIDRLKSSEASANPSELPITFEVQDAATFKSDYCFDVIVANPPYIAESDANIQKSVKDFEPSLALFAKDRGLLCIKEWALTVKRLLKPKGFVIFEIGYNQGPEVEQIFRDSGAYSSVELINDYSGLNRFVKAVRNG